VGRAVLSTNDSETTLDRGRSAFVPANRGQFMLQGDGVAFVATPALQPLDTAR
jgi:mannose-6-phosphate isomerase class I